MIPNEIEKRLIELLSIDIYTDEYDPFGDNYDEAVDLIEQCDQEELGKWFYSYILSIKDKALLLSTLNISAVVGLLDIPMKDAYRFCGYLAAMVKIENTPEGEFIDDLITRILDDNHLISLFEDLNYFCLRDPKLLEQIEYWKQRL